jgi:ribosomal protein L37E
MLMQSEGFSVSQSLCKRCNKPLLKGYKYLLCLDCLEAKTSEYHIVIDYLKNNPGSGIDKIRRETGADMDSLLALAKKGHIIINGMNPETIKFCQRCGSSVLNAKYCQSCETELRDRAREREEEEPKEPAAWHGRRARR